MRLGSGLVASAARFLRTSVGTEKCAVLLSVYRPNVQQTAPITSKAVRGEVIKPPPFPYRTTKYSFWRSWFDKTSPRMDENSKLIVVDGPPTACKADAAKGMAELLDFLYVPAASFDMVYINSYGHDFRSMDPILPPRARSFTIDDFNKNPTDDRAGMMQLMLYEIRYQQYVDVLAHILNTGQGVVMDRCVYSDRVHVEAMVKNGYLSKNFHWSYGELTHTTLRELMKPHLIVYLDLPVPEVQKRLKTRKNPALQSSQALSEKYLKDLEYFYKYNYLKKMEENCHLLVYDWTDARGVGDVEGIIEDIERLEFEKHEQSEHDPKMKDWWFPNEDEWCEARYKYTTRKDNLLSYFHMSGAWVDCPEVWMEPEETTAYMNAWEKLPGSTYAKGYNADQGDTNILFKNLSTNRSFGDCTQDREWWIPAK